MNLFCLQGPDCSGPLLAGCHEPRQVLLRRPFRRPGEGARAGARHRPPLLRPRLHQVQVFLQRLLLLPGTGLTSDTLLCFFLLFIVILFLFPPSPIPFTRLFLYTHPLQIIIESFTHVIVIISLQFSYSS